MSWAATTLIVCNLLLSLCCRFCDSGWPFTSTQPACRAIALLQRWRGTQTDEGRRLCCSTSSAVLLVPHAVLSRSCSQCKMLGRGHQRSAACPPLLRPSLPCLGMAVLAARAEHSASVREVSSNGPCTQRRAACSQLVHVPICSGACCCMCKSRIEGWCWRLHA